MVVMITQNLSVLNTTELKNGYDGNFMFHMFYHN